MSSTSDAAQTVLAPRSLSLEAPIVCVSASLAAILCIAPLVWHAKAKNFAAVSLIVWIVLLNVVVAVNAAVWSHNDPHAWWDGVGYCDVTVNLLIGYQLALPGATAVLLRSLVKVMDATAASRVVGTAERRRDAAVAVVLCVALPLLFMACSYPFRLYRYVIWTTNGCSVVFSQTWAAMIFVVMWPVLVSMLSAYYTGECFLSAAPPHD